MLLACVPSGLALVLTSCATRDVRPVDVYPEDMCAHCRMAVSDLRYASEIIAEDGSVFKFDDIGCLESFLRSKSTSIVVAGIFYRDYHGGGWVPASRATIVATGVATPMNSGKAAFADSVAAMNFVREHPPTPKDDARK